MGSKRKTASKKEIAKANPKPAPAPQRLSMKQIIGSLSDNEVLETIKEAASELQYRVRHRLETRIQEQQQTREEAPKDDEPT